MWTENEIKYATTITYGAVRRSLFMKKNRRTFLYFFLKVSLLLYVLLLFVCVDIRGNIVTAYAMNLNHGLTLPLPLISILDLAPTPTPASSPLPTSVASQPSQAIQTPQAGSTPTKQVAMPISTATGSAPAIATRPSVRAAGTTTMIPPFLIHPFLQGNKDMNVFTLSLTIGVGIPLLLIIGGTLWLLVRRQIKLLTAPSNVTSVSTLKSDSSLLPMDSPESTSTEESNGNGQIPVASDYTLKSDSSLLPMDSPELTSIEESNGNGQISLPPDSLKTVMEILPTSRE
jgi:hypothetical protein